MNEQLNIFGKSKEDLINEAFLLWKQKGYPNYLPHFNKKSELLRLKKTPSNICESTKTIKKHNGYGWLWSYFPHWIDVKYGNDKTIQELWDDDLRLKELIRKTYEYELKYGKGYITENRLRQNSKIYLSKQSVSNFSPVSAKSIYNKFGNKGVVWDMSCGWGGRLFGFMGSDCKKYIGTDPSLKTWKGLTKLYNDFRIKDVELHCIGSEDFTPEEKSIDLCFTSPPYFDTEKYSDELTQSFNKHNTKEKWVNNFLGKTIQNCFFGLKYSGFLIINIANTAKHQWLENATIEKAIENGFNLVETYKLELSSVSGKGSKYEPVFIFTKVGLQSARCS